MKLKILDSIALFPIVVFVIVFPCLAYFGIGIPTVLIVASLTCIFMLWCFAIGDIARIQGEERKNEKAIWAFVIILGTGFGAYIYYIMELRFSWSDKNESIEDNSNGFE